MEELQRRNEEIREMIERIEKHNLKADSSSKTLASDQKSTISNSSTIPEVRQKLWAFASPILQLSPNQLEAMTKQHESAKTIEIWRPLANVLFPTARMCKNLVMWGT